MLIADKETENSTAPVSQVNRYYSLDACKEARIALQEIVDSPAFNTYPDNTVDGKLGFVDKHLKYLSTHKLVSLTGYISNLKLMTRIKK
jgi:hypothetical protein